MSGECDKCGEHCLDCECQLVETAVTTTKESHPDKHEIAVRIVKHMRKPIVTHAKKTFALR